MKGGVKPGMKAGVKIGVKVRVKVGVQSGGEGGREVSGEDCSRIDIRHDGGETLTPTTTLTVNCTSSMLGWKVAELP